MQRRTRRLPWLIGIIAVSLLYAAGPVSGQGILRRLEDRVRQRLEDGRVVPPPPPEIAAEIPGSPLPANDRPRLGIEVDEVPRANRPDGVIVTGVHPNSAAAAAGLQPEDEIISFGGVPIGSVDDLTGVMQRSAPRDRLLMIILRNGQRVDLPVTLQARGSQQAGGSQQATQPGLASPLPPSGDAERVPPEPAAEPSPAAAGGGRLGIVVEDPPSTRGRRLTRGARVVEVTPGAPGAEAGLEVGDTIVAVDGRLIPDAESMIVQMRQTRPGQRIELQYVRDQELGRVGVTLAGPDGSPASRGEDAGSAEQPTRRETASRSDDPQITPQQPAESGLSGIGSVLGGLFGGGNAAGETAPPAPESAEVLPSPNRDRLPSATPPELSEASPAELQATIRRLEATNRRLENRLQQLEERMEAILGSAAADQ